MRLSYWWFSIFGKEGWASLPGGGQKLLNLDQVKEIFKESVANELQGKFVVATSNAAQILEPLKNQINS